MSEDKLKWEKAKDGNVRLLGVSETPAELVLPEMIEGLPLREVGPYCFSGNKWLERVILPDSVRKIARMAFYNCTNLKELVLGSSLMELEGDAFMNCSSLHLFSIRCSALKKSGIRLILQQISSDAQVHFLEKEGEAKLLFPEYYESYDEVAPAHLFGRNIEGEGFRARQCFKDGVIEFARYDAIFPKACAEEKVETLCSMALNRLCYPIQLKEEAKERYQDYVKKHLEEVCKKAVVGRDLELILFLCENQLMERNVIEHCVRWAAETEWAEGGAYFLRLKERFFPQIKKASRYEF